MRPDANIHTMPDAEEAANLYLEESGLRFQTRGDIDVTAAQRNQGPGIAHYRLTVEPEEGGRIMNVQLPYIPDEHPYRQPKVTGSTIHYRDILEDVHGRGELHYSVTIATPA